MKYIQTTTAENLHRVSEKLRDNGLHPLGKVANSLYRLGRNELKKKDGLFTVSIRHALVNYELDKIVAEAGYKVRSVYSTEISDIVTFDVPLKKKRSVK